MEVPTTVKTALDHGFDFGTAYALIVAGVNMQQWILIGAGVAVFLIKLASNLTDPKPPAPLPSPAPVSPPLP